jgi:hypothetical protein
MVFFYLTNCILDVSLGVLWWVTKNGSIGIYNGAQYVTYYVNSNKSIEYTPIDYKNNNKAGDEYTIINNYELLELKNEIESLKNQLRKKQ